MKKTIISKTAGNGMQVEAGVELSMGNVWMWATIDGQTEAQVLGLAPVKNHPVAKGMLGRAAFTAEECAALTTARDEMQDTDLREVRRGLVEDVRAAHAESVSRQEQGMANGTLSMSDSETKAQAALDRFDAENPEVVEEIKAENRESAQRNQWM